MPISLEQWNLYFSVCSRRVAFPSWKCEDRFELFLSPWKQSPGQLLIISQLAIFLMNLFSPSTPSLRRSCGPACSHSSSLNRSPTPPLVLLDSRPSMSEAEGPQDFRPNPWLAVKGSEARGEEVLRLQHQLSHPGPLAVFSCLRSVIPKSAGPHLHGFKKIQILGLRPGSSGSWKADCSRGSSSWACVETTMVNGGS